MFSFAAEIGTVMIERGSFRRASGWVDILCVTTRRIGYSSLTRNTVTSDRSMEQNPTAESAMDVTGAVAPASADATPNSSKKVARRRRLLFVLATVVIGLASGLILAEVTTRVFGIRPERYPSPVWMTNINGSYYDLKMWGHLMGRWYIKRPSRFEVVQMGEYVENAVFKTVYGSNPRGYFDADNGVIMTINSLGLRGPDEITVEKPENTFRILGLGDSFTFGVGVRDPDTFLRQLEGLLNADCPFDPKQTVQVLNAGTQGYNTRDEVLYLEHRWLKLGLEPDLILITFYLNDAYSDEAFRNMGQGLAIDLRELNGLARYSRVADLIQHAYRARRVRLEMEKYYERIYFTNPRAVIDTESNEQHYDWNVSKAALKRAAKLAQAHNIKIALVIFPELQNMNGRYPFEAIHELVRDTAESLEIPVMDLLDTYRGRRDRDLWVHPSDHHPNEFAHKLAAMAIDRFLRQEVLSGERDLPLQRPTTSRR